MAKVTVPPEAAASVMAERSEPGRVSSAVWVTINGERVLAPAFGSRPAIRHRPSRAHKAARLTVERVLQTTVE